MPVGPVPRRVALVVLVCLGGLSPGVRAQQPAGKSAPPAGEQAEALEKVRFEFRQEFADANSDAAAGRKLAGLLLEQVYKARDGGKPRPPADEFVRLDQSAALAARAGDLDLSLQAVDELDRGYAVDVDAKRAAALSAAVGTPGSQAERKAFVELALRYLEQAVDRDAFDAAAQLAAAAEAEALKSKSLPLVLTVLREQKGVAEVRRRHDALKPALERLRQQPEDPGANLEVGKYYGLFKGQWERGLYLLAQSDDPDFRLLAQRDLARPAQPDDQVTLGHRWWDLADGFEGQARVHLRQRAVHWYEQGVYGLEGAERQTIEERIAAVPRPQAAAVPWDYSGPPKEIKLLGRHNGTVFGVDFSPDGRRVISGGTDNQAVVWDAQSGQKLHTLATPRGLVWGVAFDPRSRYALTGSWDENVTVWDARTGKQLRSFRHPLDVNGIAVTRDGRRVLSTADDGQVRVWDVETGKLVHQLNGHRGAAYSVAVAADGRRAVSGGAGDNTLIVWDLQAGKETRRMQGIAGSIRTCAVTPDGRQAVAAGEQTVRVWDLQTGKELRNWQANQGVVNAVAISPDGRRLATGGSDGSIRYWDLATGRELHAFRGNNGPVYALAFSPGGGRLASGAADNSVRLWGLPR